MKPLVTLVSFLLLSACATTIVDTHYIYRVEGESKFRPPRPKSGPGCPYSRDVIFRAGKLAKVGMNTAELGGLVLSITSKKIAVFSSETFEFVTPERTNWRQHYGSDKLKFPFLFGGGHMETIHIIPPQSDFTLIFPDLIIDGTAYKLPKVEYQLTSGPRKDYTGSLTCTM